MDDEESVTGRTLRLMKDEWTRPYRDALDAAQDEIERLLSEIAAVRIERDNRDAALTAVLKVHQQDPYNARWCVCEELWPCSTTVAIAEALGGDA